MGAALFIMKRLKKLAVSVLGTVESKAMVFLSIMSIVSVLKLPAL